MYRIAGIEPNPICLAVPEGYNLHISNIEEWVEYNDRKKKEYARREGCFSLWPEI